MSTDLSFINRMSKSIYSGSTQLLQFSAEPVGSLYEEPQILVAGDRPNFLADEVSSCAGDLTLKSGTVYV